jgi:hypothetical protein
VKNSELALTVVGTGLAAVLCLLLIVRRSYREFPIFFASVGLSVGATIILLIVSNNTSYYALVFWPSDALGVLLAFLALNEALRSVFRNFLGMRWFRWLFPGIGIVMISAAVLRILLLPRPAFSLFTTTIISLEIAIGFLQFGIFSLFIILVRLFHLRWRQHAAGIVFGYGVSAAGSLVAFLLRSEFGTKFDPVVRIAPPIAYIIGVAVWLATFLRAESARSEAIWDPALTPDHMIAELRRHTKTVKGILGR